MHSHRRTVQTKTGNQTVTSTTNYFPQTPSSPQTPQRSASASRSRPVRDYSPTKLGEGAGNAVGALEAEYLACMFLIVLTVFVDGTSDYASKMLAVMKRGTLATILFFILALFSSTGPNAAKVSKALGALTIAGIFLGTAGQGAVSALDKFFQADWTQNNSSQGGSTANTPGNSNSILGLPFNSLANMSDQASLVPGNILSQLRSGIQSLDNLAKKAFGSIPGL